MAGKSTTTAINFTLKKLLNKANTSNLKTDAEEVIGSNIQADSSRLFGQSIPSSPTRTLNTVQGSTVEYVQFTLEAIAGTNYDANDAGGGAGSDSGESSQSGGTHAYQFKLPSDYSVGSSNNPKKGSGDFISDRVVHETLGGIQLVPTLFSSDAPNPYVVKIYKDDGLGGLGDEIPLLDNIDWSVDYYNGVLFVQDYDASKQPAFARAFMYVGDYLNTVVSNAGGGGGGTASQLFTDPQDGSLNTTGSISIAGSLGNTHIASSVGTDVFFFVSGAIGSAGSSEQGTSAFGGDVVVSGSLFANVSGSITNLPDGTSFIKSGQGIKVTTGSNGSIQIKQEKEMIFNEKLLGTVDGVNTYFRLSNTPFSNDQVSVFVNGLLQVPQDIASYQDYAVTGSDVYFTTASAPDVGSIVLANYYKEVT